MYFKINISNFFMLKIKKMITETKAEASLGLLSVLLEFLYFYN